MSAAGSATARPSRPRKGKGGRVLFEVPFASAMDDADLAVLGRTLDLYRHTYTQMRPDPNSPGVVRLDRFSGIFLERGEGEGRWVLEGRTWGTPAPESVHAWHVLAAGVARVLDPDVEIPERLERDGAEIPDRPVGEVFNRPLAAFRRHLAGLP